MSAESIDSDSGQHCPPEVVQLMRPCWLGLVGQVCIQDVEGRAAGVGSLPPDVQAYSDPSCAAVGYCVIQAALETARADEQLAPGQVPPRKPE